jgi:hypothetical protein
VGGNEGDRGTAYALATPGAPPYPSSCEGQHTPAVKEGCDRSIDLASVCATPPVHLVCSWPYLLLLRTHSRERSRLPSQTGIYAAYDEQPTTQLGLEGVASSVSIPPLARDLVIFFSRLLRETTYWICKRRHVLAVFHDTLLPRSNQFACILIKRRKG